MPITDTHLIPSRESQIKALLHSHEAYHIKMITDLYYKKGNIITHVVTDDDCEKAYLVNPITNTIIPLYLHPLSTTLNHLQSSKESNRREY